MQNLRGPNVGERVLLRQLELLVVSQIVDVVDNHARQRGLPGELTQPVVVLDAAAQIDQRPIERGITQVHKIL